MEDNSIYQAPDSQPETDNLCPKCQSPMQLGTLRSSGSINWLEEDASLAKKFITGGSPIAKTKAGFGVNYRALHCKACKLFILDSD